MITLRTYNRINRAVLILLPILFAEAACSPLPPLPTLAVLPTYSIVTSAASEAISARPIVPGPVTRSVPPTQPTLVTEVPEPLPTDTLQINVVDSSQLNPPTPIGRDPRIRSGQTDTPIPLDPEHVWADQPIGNDHLTVSFFNSGNDGCVRYVMSNAPDKVVESCAGSQTGTILAVQGMVNDSGLKPYTIIVGRVFSDRITAVSVEMDKSSDTHAEVIDHGFLFVLAGKHNVLSVIPIDQYGNLVGAKFLFH